MCLVFRLRAVLLCGSAGCPFDSSMAAALGKPFKGRAQFAVGRQGGGELFEMAARLGGNLALGRRRSQLHMMSGFDLHLDVIEGVTGLREMMDHPWQQLLEAHGCRTVATVNHQHAFFQIDHLTFINECRRQRAAQAALKLQQAAGMILQAGKGVGTAEETVQGAAHGMKEKMREREIYP